MMTSRLIVHLAKAQVVVKIQLVQLVVAQIWYNDYLSAIIL